MLAWAAGKRTVCLILAERPHCTIPPKQPAADQVGWQRTDVLLLCCSVFMGLPLIAWLTVLQRQRVVAKHAVVEKEEDAWATMALYPCSLLQMHVLLKQQQQPVAGQAAAPYKAPKVQQMVAGEHHTASRWRVTEHGGAT